MLSAALVLRIIDLRSWRAQLIASGERHASSLALITSEYLKETFNVGDAMMRQLVVHGQRVGGPGASAAAWAPALEASRAGMTGLGSISVVDANGTIAHSTLGLLVGQSRASEYLFRRLSTLDRDELAVDGPFLTIPEPRHIVIPIGRRMTTSDGAFSGLIVSTFGPDQLTSFFKTVDVGPGGSIWVFHPNGVILFAEPSANHPVGSSAAGHPLFEAARTDPSAVTHTRLTPDGPMLIGASRTIAVPPLTVAVALSESELLAAWSREVGLTIARFVLAGLAFIAGLIAFGRHIEARTAAEDALKRAQQFESIGRLAGGIAHDFNNLLTAILGYTNLMLDEIGPAHPLRGDLEEVRKAGQSAAALISQLLAFSRRQVLQPQIIDLNAVVMRIESMLQRVIGEHIRFAVHLERSIAPINADPSQIEQIVMNLALNARDAMPKGGSLTIETSSVQLDRAYSARHPETPPGPYVLLAVSDTGMGMDEATRAHIFEPFFTTKALGKGTGLGLATVYGIVRQSGGAIEVYSEPGKGTSFKVYLPVAVGAETPSGAESAVTETTGTETILLAEDQAEVRAVATSILTRNGYTVLDAAGPEEALRVALEYPKRIDLLFTDVVMPGMSGPQLAERVQQVRPGTLVLYCSGYTDDAIVRHGVLEHGIAFIQKPYALDALLHKVRDVLDARV